jgi:hypothetical protein
MHGLAIENFKILILEATQKDNINNTLSGIHWQNH